MDGVTRLALAAGDGDRAALEAFVRSTEADVWRFCAHLTSAEEADDLAQDTYLRAVRSLPRFRGESSAHTWLLAIARRACADHVRRLVRRRRLQRRVESETGADEHLVDAPGEVELDELVAALDPDRREAFVLTQILGLSYAEAAEVCGCPIGTIRSRVARAREALVALVERADAADDSAPGRDAAGG